MLVTVDVLSEGVDLPVADTCLFVAPRRRIRLRQCVGRVLRNHPEKIDAAWLVGVFVEFVPPFGPSFTFTLTWFKTVSIFL